MQVPIVSLDRAMTAWTAFVILAGTPAAAQAQAGNWSSLPKMTLERQFAGPLQDTVIQRLRDPADGTICYLYLPISAPHTPVTASGFVQYGGNTIGSISCVPGRLSAAAGAKAPAR